MTKFKTRYGHDTDLRIRVPSDFPGAIFGLMTYGEPMFWYITIPFEIDVLLD